MGQKRAVFIAAACALSISMVLGACSKERQRIVSRLSRRRI